MNYKFCVGFSLFLLLFNNEIIAKTSSNKSVFEQIESCFSVAQYDSAEMILNRYSQRNVLKNDELANFWLYKAQILKFQEKTGLSLLYFLKAQRYFSQKKKIDLLVFCNAQMMEFYRKFSKHKEGILLAQQTERKLESKEYISNKTRNLFYNRFAALVNEQNMAKMSIVYSGKALVYAELEKDTNSIAISYNELGFSYKNSNQVQKAIDAYTKAKLMWEKIGFLRQSLHADYNIVIMKTHSFLIPLNAQINEYLRILNSAHSINCSDYDLQCNSDISLCYRQLNQWKKAYKYDQLAHKIQYNELLKLKDVSLKKALESFKTKALNKELSTSKKEQNKQLESIQAQKRNLWLVSSLTLLIVFGLVYSLVLQKRVRQSYNEIQKKDEQKSILIGEIHHRVKNNLQYVKSLLEMQISIISETGQKEDLQDVSRRIQAMTLVHEMLYVNSENSGVSIQDYFRLLIQNLIVGYDTAQKIEIDFEVCEAEVSISEATSLGIICAELFNNAVKYAFMDNKNPHFYLQFIQKNSGYELIIRDNGKKKETKQNENDKDRYKLGMRIIDIFARQLNGKYSISYLDGYFFQLNYMKPKL